MQSADLWGNTTRFQFFFYLKVVAVSKMKVAYLLAFK